MSNINEPIKGFNDIFGSKLTLRKYIESLFSKIVTSYGYTSLEVPIVEKATSFNENVVGKSPWPEWDQKGCMYLDIKDYINSYSDSYEKIATLLIPEGTVSVTRWLGNVLDNGKIQLPVKIFYSLPCFRNEIINELTELKQRQFYQFGLEILGASNEIADCENLYLAIYLLESLGFQKEWITIRISNVEIFTNLVTECNINHTDSIIIKENLDILAECRAGKKPERFISALSIINNTIGKYSILDKQKNMWDAIINNDNNKENLLKTFNHTYSDAINSLFRLYNEFLLHKYNVFIDLSVVRSHEYYTGISFEIDIKNQGMSYIEIAGGGRYDKLVEKFTTSKVKNGRIPSTGFAFGMNRLIDCYFQMGLNLKASLKMDFSFDESRADSIVSLTNYSVKGYLDTVHKLNLLRSKGKRIDVLVVDFNNNNIANYKLNVKANELICI